jgi:DNA-binding transcriptional MerR regulator
MKSEEQRRRKQKIKAWKRAGLTYEQIGAKLHAEKKPDAKPA